jgi:hypothetical protein
MPRAIRKHAARESASAARRRRRAGARAFLLTLSVLVCGAYGGAQQTIKLERGWQFLADKEGTLKANDVGRAGGWRDARVGLSWNAQFADLRDYMGVAWYRARFDAPALQVGRRALLNFGAVDYYSEVFVNGRRVGEHEGGYTPFGFDVTENLKPGENELLVRVVDPPMDEKENRARFPSMMYNEIPHGKQNWYVQTGGVWQPVSLELRPSLYLKYVRVTPAANGDVSVEVQLAGRAHQDPNPVEVTVRNPEGGVEFRTGGGGITTMTPRTFRGKVKSPRLWGVARPSLYSVEVKLNNGEDALTERFGFRSFEARAGKFYLNGEPFYMIAALDQDFYPETIYTPPSEEYVRDAMRKAKRLGLNMLRCHIKVCDPVYLKVADEEGVLVWYEIPSWNDFNHFSTKAAERGERVLQEMTARDWNHPSIVIQSVINESWGADLKKPEQRRWLREAYERAKKLTAPRGLLVVDNSACCDNFHVKTDINDFHQYFSQPDNSERWDKWVADFATRPAWTFSRHGDAETTRAEPLVVSEFGNWGLPRLPKDLPWWFARDFGGREVTRPGGVFDRFREFHLQTLFRDYDELAVATEWHQFRSLKHEIEEIRRHDPIQGYVITEFTDINWEANGLLDMWRNPKAYAADLAKIQQPDLVMARTDKLNYTSGDTILLDVLLSHYGGMDLRGGVLTWYTETWDGRRRHRIGRPPVGSAAALIPQQMLAAPDVTSPRRERIFLEVRDSRGRLAAQNTAEVFLYPKPGLTKEATSLVLALHDPKNSSPGLRQSLGAAGYNLLSNGTPLPGVLMLATAVDDFVKSHLRGGGRAIILADSKDALPPGASIKVVPREGDLDGNWVTNFNWVRINREPFKSVAFGPLLGFEGVEAVPRFVIRDVAGADYEDVLAGIFYGWINNNAALCVQMKAGAGRVLLTTFRFDSYGRDPYATRLLDAMIAYVGGQGFAPRLDWDAIAVK